jgi:hypothetical protein
VIEKRSERGPQGSNRVIRGGSWSSNARNVRAANRNWNHPGDRNDNLGFRLARAQRLTATPLTRPRSCPPATGAGGESRAGAGALVGRQKPPRTLAGALFVR